jgi:hypothetical protein
VRSVTVMEIGRSPVRVRFRCEVVAVAAKVNPWPGEFRAGGECVGRACPPAAENFWVYALTTAAARVVGVTVNVTW